jgi:hypothetical protein
MPGLRKGQSKNVVVATFSEVFAQIDFLFSFCAGPAALRLDLARMTIAPAPPVCRNPAFFGDRDLHAPKYG